MADSIRYKGGLGTSERNVPPPLGGERVASRAWATEDLVQYLAEFELTLADLEPDQLAMFVAARNAVQFVEDLEIPVATKPQKNEGESLLEEETEARQTQTAYYSDYLQTHVPENEMSIGLIQGAEDLPRIFPTQWLLEEICPTAFYSKLADRELFMPRWERPSSDPRDGDEDTRQWEFLDELATASSTRQHAYVLLDTSRSMNDRDCRGTVARGLTLAFLLHGQGQRARLRVRPFAAKISELSCGHGKADFCAIARRVMELPNMGQTRIQPALEQATSDIRSVGLCLRADILLITDGVSRLARNPLVGEKLHTFILGNLQEKAEPLGTVATLKSWSETFRHIWKPQFAEILAPRAGDLSAATAVLERALEQFRNGTAVYTAHELRRMTDNIQSLLKGLHRWGDGKSLSQTDRESLEHQLELARKTLARMLTSSRTRRRERSTSAARFEALRAITISLMGHGNGERSGLWQFLRQLVARLSRWFRRTIQRFLRGPSGII